MDDQDQDNYRFKESMDHHHSQIGQQILDLLTIPDESERDVQLSALLDILRREIHAINAVTEYLRQTKVLASGGKVRRNYREDLEFSMECLEQFLPQVFRMLTGRQLLH